MNYMRRTSAIVAFALAFTACGPSLREKTIHTTLVATNATREAFVTYDEHKQLDIVEHAPTEAEGLAQLEAYKARRDRLVAAFEHLYRALAIAAVLNDDATSLSNVIEAARILEAEIKAVTGKGLR
jgi:hypothetical protein